MSEPTLQERQHQLIIEYMRKRVSFLISNQALQQSEMTIRHRTERDAIRGEFGPLYLALVLPEKYLQMGEHKWNGINADVFEGQHPDIVDEGHDYLCVGWNEND